MKILFSLHVDEEAKFNNQFQMCFQDEGVKDLSNKLGLSLPQMLSEIVVTPKVSYDSIGSSKLSIHTIA